LIIIVIGALLLPVLLIGAWIAMWFVHKSKRWLYYFPAGLAAMILLAAVVFLSPRVPCPSSAPAMCLDDFSVFGLANTYTGLWAWIILLALTGLIELGRHLAYRARLRRTTDESPIDYPNDRTSW
jgi:bacteriorhodopsin